MLLPFTTSSKIDCNQAEKRPNILFVSTKTDQNSAKKGKCEQKKTRNKHTEALLNFFGHKFAYEARAFFCWLAFVRFKTYTIRNTV